MDRRLKIITISLCVVYAINICGFIYRETADAVYGVKIGINEGLKMAESGRMGSLSTAGIFFLSLKPENGMRTFPTKLRNQLDRASMKVEYEKMVVEVSDARDKLPKGTIEADICSIFLSLFSLFVMVLIPVQTFRILNSVSKNKIFDPANIDKLRIIGYSSLAFYVSNLIINFFHYRIATHVVEIDGYSLQMDWGNITIVLLGFVVLMFAEVLKVSVQLKEEQELTV